MPSKQPDDSQYNQMKSDWSRGKLPIYILLGIMVIGAVAWYWFV